MDFRQLQWLPIVERQPIEKKLKSFVDASIYVSIMRLLLRAVAGFRPRLNRFENENFFEISV
ncbi:MAG: hypothetical protein AAGJ52_04385, partial [Pseudomonadota bacterium]